MSVRVDLRFVFVHREGERGRRRERESSVGWWTLRGERGRRLSALLLREILLHFYFSFLDLKFEAFLRSWNEVSIPKK